jgi:hypothetical protein
MRRIKTPHFSVLIFMFGGVIFLENHSIYYSTERRIAMNQKRAGLFFILMAALILSGVIGYQAFRAQNVQAANKTVVGDWKVTVTPDGGSPFTAGAIFSNEGTVIMMENDGRLGLGVWDKSSGNQYSFSVWEYWLDNGSYFQAKVSSTIELSRDKETYTGPFDFQVYDLAGNLLVQGTGTATGVRQYVDLISGQGK